MPSTELAHTLAGVVALVFAYMTAWFLIALAVGRNDVVDIAWGLGFIVIAGWLLAHADATPSPRQIIASVLVLVWGGRLAWHIARRNLRPGATEDTRYAAWRRAWGRWFVIRSYFQIFMLQGLFMILISMPITVIATSPRPLGALDAVGIVVWCIGFAFEAIGDAQLAYFLARPENRGRIMDQGLWAYTRHPNYFGEATMWWGLGISALNAPGGLVALVGPVTITWLLTKVSGIPLLERKREGDPAWEAYKARTSAFFPRPPRRSEQERA